MPKNYNDIKSFANNFMASPSANASYKIIMAYSNMGQRKYAKEIYKWAIIADDYGHNLASSVMESYVEFTTVREREDAQKDAEEILSALQ